MRAMSTDALTLNDLNERIAEAERFALGLPQVDLQTRNLIHGGMCARTIFIPAGTFLTGALTRMDNICVVCGDIEVTTDEGVRRITGFDVLPARAGAKRAGRTFADTWWTTLLRTDAQTVEDVEDQMTPEAEHLQTRQRALQASTLQTLEA